MLCYRCGSHVPDDAESCSSCGQKLAGGGVRQATGTFSRKRPAHHVIEGAPYRPEDTIAGRYLVKDTLGAGPLGFVFRAHDQEVDVEVAIKVINPRLAQTADERKQFAKVLRDGRKLTHPHLARIYEEGEDQDRPFYTSQFLEGLTLRKIIDLRIGKGQFFGLQELEPILAQVVSALEGAHVLGPHSDLKPENVIVLPDLLKVTDFGLGLAIPRLPFVQAQKGRKADRYLSPELAEGREVDHRADLYSLGVILGEMLSGLTPDGAIPELGRRNPEVPAAVEGIYRKALHHNPLARFGSAAEMLEAFSEALRKHLPPPLQARPEPAPGEGARPRPAVAAASAPALQLPPRRAEKPATPPPPPVDDHLPLDATQRVDPAMIPYLQMPPPKAPPPPPEVPRRTAVLPEQEPDNADTQAMSSPPALFGAVTARRPAPQASTVWVVGLIVAGLVLGSTIGFYWKSRGVVVTAMPAEPAAEPTPAPIAAPPPPATVHPVESPPKKSVDEPKAAAPSPREERKAPPAAKLAAAKVGGAEPGGCPDGMRLVPGGSFRMGTAKDDPMMGFDERALASVEVAAFCIDQFEYPNRRGVSPVVSVSWADARRLCEGKGKRLCAEEEWEKACKGPGNARFPYGSTYDPNACNTEDEAGDDRLLASAGQFAKCRSGYGVADLSGNAAEWTSSAYGANADKAQKGGAFNRPDYAARCSARKNGAPASRSAEVGFRCCTDVGR